MGAMSDVLTKVSDNFDVSVSDTGKSMDSVMNVLSSLQKDSEQATATEGKPKISLEQKKNTTKLMKQIK